MRTKYIICLTLFTITSCRKINNDGLEIIKKYEGFDENFYKDFNVILNLLIAFLLSK
jgi:hypothetical protein